jgi:hypothetical protein
LPSEGSLADAEINIARPTRTLHLLGEEDMAYAKKLFASACALAVGFALGGCSNSADDGPNFPGPPPDTFVAQYSPTTTGFLPFPSDLPAFVGSTDGTLNFTGSLAAAPFLLTGGSLNTLDGFSTSAPITTSFNAAIDGSTLSGSTVVMIEMYLSNTNKGPATTPADLPPGVTNPVRRVLTFGVDYTAEVSNTVDSAGKILKITPLKPLAPSSGAINSGYIVLLTNGIRDFTLRQAQPSDDYATVKNAPANCSGIGNASLAQLCPWFKGHLAIAQRVGVNPANVVLSWSFSTQSTEDSLRILGQTVPAQAIAVQATGLTTKQVDARLAGKANVYVGTTAVPYYLAKPANVNDRTFLTSFWVAGGPPPAPLDQTSRFITRFNPVPVNRGTTTIPLLVTVPNSTANASGGGCTKPAAGWPVAIVQHGLGGDRTNAFFMADQFADACFIVASFDLPMHGITNTASPLYQAPNERTFNVDLQNNTTGAAGPDGKIDNSGVHSIPTLLSSPLTGRDLLRQGQADVAVVAKSLARLDVTGDGVSDVDATRVHYVGLSLGGIAGVAQAKYAPGIRTVTVAAPGGVVTRILRESPSFAPTVNAAVAASAPVGSTLYENLFREIQTIADPGDPINHICECANNKPFHLIKVVADTVVPNSTTDLLVTAGGLARLKSGVTPVTPGKGVYVSFIQGSHGSLFDPTASAAATAEMQRQSILFAVSAIAPGGPFLTITNPAVVEQ